MVAEDQSLPEHAQGKISRRNGAAAEVHVVRLDGNFAAVDPAKCVYLPFFPLEHPLTYPTLKSWRGQLRFRWGMFYSRFNVFDLLTGYSCVGNCTRFGLERCI